MYQHNDVVYSPGGSTRYRIIGAVCRLYDRDELPYPCCRLQWHGKEPFWNRVGKRFVPDLAARRCESYNVEVVGYGVERILSLYHKKLPYDKMAWWFTLDRKKENYVSEIDIYYGHSKQSSKEYDIRQASVERRDKECVVHGN